MNKSPNVFHKLKTVFFYSIASIVIVAALGVSSLRLILTTANLYQIEVEELASNLLEQPVKIGRMDAALRGLVPTLIFHDVQLLSKKTHKSLFSLTQVDVGLSYKQLVIKQEIIPEQITVRGVELYVTRTKEGIYKVKGFDLDALNTVSESETNSIIENWLLRKGEVGLEDSTLVWVDEKNAGLKWRFDDVNFLLKKVQSRYQLLLSSRLPKALGNKIELALDLNGDITSPSTWNVRAFIESKGFKTSPLEKYIKNESFNLINGVADLKLWLDWEKKKLKQLSGDVKLKNLSYKIGKRDTVNLNLVSGIFDSRRDENDIWNVSVDKFKYKNDERAINESRFSLALKFKEKNISSFEVKANYLKLETLSKIVIDNHLSNLKYEKILNYLKIHGEINDFYISWKDNVINKVNAVFSGFEVNSWNNIPKMAGLSGNLLYENKEGRLSLSSTDAIIGFPNLFRQDFKLDELGADIIFLDTKEALLVESQGLSIKNNDVEATASVKLWLPLDNSSPHIDLQTYISKGDVSKTSHFLPVTIMDESLVKWIDKSLIKGKVNKGTIVLNGKVNDFPYNNKEGLFNVDVDVSNLTLKYLDDWPEIRKGNINGLFTGQGLRLHLSSGESRGNVLYDSYAEVDSYLKAELDLNISTKGSTHSFVQYLVNSPILSKSAVTLSSMRFTGDVVSDVKINVPLSNKLLKEKSLSYSGSANFTDASVFMLNDRVDITNGAGKLLFSEKGLSSKNLTANVFAEKSRFSVSSNLKDKSIKIKVNGKMKPSVVLKRFDIPGYKNISGKTSFNAEMIFPNKLGKNKNPTLQVFSRLIGMKSRLPDSFFKKSNTPANFNFKTIFSTPDKIQFAANLGEHGSSVIELDQSGESSYLKKGAISFSAKKAILPTKNILYVDGAINAITPAKWFDALDLKKEKGKSSFFRNPIIFNLDKVNVLRRVYDENNKSNSTNPAKLPVFEGIIKKLYLDELFLGRLDVKTSQVKYGLRFDEVILSAKNMKLFSHGDWSYKRESHKTEMDITLSSNDFGSMLNNLGFEENIRKGTAQAAGKLMWFGTPSEYSLDKLNGDVHLKIQKGNIKEVDAGVGRLLGLFSLSALPRKLIGDFNDAFKSGFSFDEAEGAINIEDGDAYTEDFAIISPVAEISISGRTGLVDRDYENIVEVTPDVGGGLAGITALLVNLPAGIGLWLVDKITGEQFNEASANIYEMTGSWDSPKIEKVEDK